MCSCLDHVMKSLQLPCGITWIHGTPILFQDDAVVFHTISHLIFTSAPPLLGSSDFKNEETEGLKLGYDEQSFKPRQLASIFCGLSQYIRLPSYIDDALLKRVAGWFFSSFIWEIFVKSTVTYENVHISLAINMEAKYCTRVLGIYKKYLCHNPCIGLGFKI